MTVRDETSDSVSVGTQLNRICVNGGFYIIKVQGCVGGWWDVVSWEISKCNLFDIIHSLPLAVFLVLYIYSY